MADNLVKLLNANGYQPIFLPRSGVVPPDLYNFAEHRLIRRGGLANYIPQVSSLKPKPATMADIEGKQSSGKNFSAAAEFLSSALSALGISGVPKLNLSFTGAKQLSFSFSNITVLSVDPSEIDGILQGLKAPPSIPEEYVTEGALHIAYEYIYSNMLLMSRADGGSFSANVRGDIGSYVNLGGKGRVQWKGESAISFTSNTANPAAFAYKAGRLQRLNHLWTFEPEVVVKKGRGPDSYIPARGIVLRTEDTSG